MFKIGDKVQVLIDDVAGRFKAGEVGEVTELDDGYACLVSLPGSVHVPLFGGVETKREYYFYENEVKYV